MVRVRAYTLTLCLPLIVILMGFIISVSTDEIAGVSSFWIGNASFAFGIVLQALFAIAVACPRCSKSPYAFGPFKGPFSLGGKPVPDRVCSNCGFNLAAREVEE